MTNTTETTDGPALYCGTYAKYNAGSIAGAWLQLDDYSDAEDFFAACKALHKDEHDPEYMFQDFECFPDSLYSESMSKEDAEKLFLYVNIPEDDRAMVNAYIYLIGEFTVDTYEQAQDAYSGNYNSDEEFAEQLAEDICAIPDGLAWPCNCIDWKHAAREIMYDYMTHDDFYFHNY